MGKLIDYPRASFKASQLMAESVDALGGNTSAEMCAEKMGLKIGGGFNNILSSAQKFKLVSYKTGYISITQLYKDIKLSYTEEERSQLVQSAFLSPPVFAKLYDRFRGKELPVNMLDKMLIKEYQVDDGIASRIKKYFIDGAKTVGLLNAQNQLIQFDKSKSIVEEQVIEDLTIPLEASTSFENNTLTNFLESDEFVFHITGPGINSRVAIREEEDFIILDAMIKKVKKRFDASEAL